MKPLSPGQIAPDFQLNDGHGTAVSLGDLIGRSSGGVAVVFFYPKNGTPVCTAETCAFRDAFDEFVDAGAAVAGISSDPPQSHAAVAEQRRLRFPLLSDPDGSVRRAYGAVGLFGLPGRVTFVIDRDRTVRHTFASALRAGRHVEEALGVVRSIAARSGADTQTDA